MNPSLLNARVEKLAVRTSPDVARWFSIYDALGYFICLVDRTGHVRMPFNFKIYEPFEMPTDLSGFDLSYDQCCQERVEQIVKISKEKNQPIYIFYSGGIDSTVVLISFMKYLSEKDFKDKINVVLTGNSVLENSSFYYDFIRKKCRTFSSENFQSFFSSDIITVGGEHNDQLFGSDILLKMYYYVTADNFHNPYSREFVVSFFGNKMSSDDANFWYDLIESHIKHHAPCEVKTNFHFFWWYNFCFKWQNVYFRMLNVIPENQHSIINENFLRNNYHHFFNSVSFQKWSMLNHHLKIGDSWNDYKLEAKNVIYDYTKNTEYKKHKIKMNSLYRLWSQRRLVLGITDDYKMLYDIDPDDFYQRDNDFV